MKIYLFSDEKNRNVLDLMNNKVIHKELLMVAHIVHFPYGHNYIKKTITTSCNECLTIKFRADKVRSTSNMSVVKSMD